MSVNLFTENQTFDLTRADKPPVRVCVKSGELVVSGYRGQSVVASSGAHMRSLLDDLDEAHDREADRALTLKEAATNPVPAWIISLNGKDILTPVGVRGVERRVGNALVTYPSGTKGSVETQRLLRDLSIKDRVEVTVAVRSFREAKAAAGKAPGVSVWDARDSLAFEAPLRFDLAEDRWESTYDGEAVVGWTPDEVLAKVEKLLLLSTYTFGVTVSEHLPRPLASLVDGDGRTTLTRVFKTSDEATAYLDARKRYEVARRELEEIVGGLRLDLSRWTSD